MNAIKFPTRRGGRPPGALYRKMSQLAPGDVMPIPVKSQTAVYWIAHRLGFSIRTAKINGKIFLRREEQ